MTTPPADELRALAVAWAQDDPDPATRAELEAMVAADDEAALREHFGTRLEFGTAGLRGKLGAGPNRMNRALVRRAAAGLVGYLRHHGLTDGGVVIGYDARHQSAEFAADTAAVVAGAGMTAHLLSRPLPTPLLAYAIRDRHADAGVMVTASHNPAEYNGYKVYLGDGAQIIPPTDQEIAADIESVVTLDRVAMAGAGDPLIVAVGEDVVVRYLSDAVSQSLMPGPRDLAIVYTPMHGVGGSITTRLLALAGFADVTVVTAQFEPDPDFPTVAFPNPEEPGAMDLALAEARTRGADVVLANDPDADRLGVAVPLGPEAGGPWQALSGDAIGALLADHLLAGTTGDDRLLVTSIVSSTLLSKMAAAAGVHFIETLTGFKWLARSVDSHPGWRFLFGYEEALGYCAGTMVRDKDGITAALLFADLVAGLKSEGRTVHDRLDDLARAHGAHVTHQWSSTVTGPDGPARIREVVEGLRTAPPAELAGLPVTEFVDLQVGASGLPPTDGLVMYLGHEIRVIVRPSGTEPKVKLYFEVVEAVHDGDVVAARARGGATVARLKQAMALRTGLPA